MGMQFNVRSASEAMKSEIVEKIKAEIVGFGFNPESDPDTAAAAWGNNGKSVSKITGKEWERTAAEIIFPRKCHFGASVSGHKITLETRNAVEAAYLAVVPA